MFYFESFFFLHFFVRDTDFASLFCLIPSGFQHAFLYITFVLFVFLASSKHLFTGLKRLKEVPQKADDSFQMFAVATWSLNSRVPGTNLPGAAALLFGT